MTFNSARIVQPGKMQLILAFADKLSCGANYLFKAPLQLVQLSHPGGSQQVARGHLFLFMFVSFFFAHRHYYSLQRIGPSRKQVIYKTDNVRLLLPESKSLRARNKTA